jgi:rubrerythrin
MRANRQDHAQYRDRLGEFYRCLTKVPYLSRIPATRQAYALECIRPGRIYTVYTCPHCGYYHVGRQPKKPGAA